MSLFAALIEKPWLTPGLDSAAMARSNEERPFDAGIGLGVFLGVVTILFLLITSAYLMRMGAHGAIGHGAGDWASLTEPPLLWVNTGVLVLSSLAFRFALAAARHRQSSALRVWLLAGGALGIAFLVGQIALWRLLGRSGYFLAVHSGFCSISTDPLTQPANVFLSGNPAVAFLYLITGLHGLHIAGGLGAWGRTIFHMSGGFNAPSIERSVTLCARYWHFLLAVWLAMFGLLLMT